MNDVRVPKMGMEDGDVEVNDIFVSIGDRVVAGQALAEVEGDKITFEISAERAGIVISILVAPGDEARVGDVILQIDEED